MIHRRPSSTGISLIAIKLADEVRAEIEAALREQFGENGGVFDVRINRYTLKLRTTVYIEVISQSDDGIPAEPGVLRFKL